MATGDIHALEPRFLCHLYIRLQVQIKGGFLPPVHSLDSKVQIEAIQDRSKALPAASFMHVPPCIPQPPPPHTHTLLLEVWVYTAWPGVTVSEIG